MLRTKSVSLYLILGSMVMIVAAVGVTAILQKNSQESTDVRARASAASNLEVTGMVVSVDDLAGTIQITSVKFKTDYGANLGTWTVTPPRNFSLSQARVGSTLLLKVRPESFAAATHTLTATEINVK